MKKRIISLFVALIACVGLCLGLVGCNKCAHENKTLTKDTATCVDNGIAAYQCNDCGKTIEEESKALGHDYNVFVKDSATCTASGYMTYKCSRCSSTKDIYSAKKAHNYSGAKCKSCGAIKPDFTSKAVKYSTSGTFEVSDTIKKLEGKSVSIKISLTFNKDSTSVKLFVSVSLSSTYLIHCNATIYDDEGNLILSWSQGYMMSSYVDTDTLTSKRALAENENCYVEISAIKI